ncbi:MAG: protein kinase [Dysgonamonadaceae bacterium]|jgi:serine/threonine protein kinase|nr:protein kinase [Dysgonamonadaceae bacterium]
MPLAERCDFNHGDSIEHKYYVEKQLGEGSFGTVFKVKDISGHTFALKLLKLWEVPPEIREKLTDRFDMEFETGQIKSNYLVQSVAHGFTKGNPYIVMEFCPKGNLNQFVKTNSQSGLVKMTKEVLFGLRDLHRFGKVHRDLKPENVLIKENGTAALTDFGISGDRNKRMTERSFLGNPTQIFGTYAYMPPEQIRPDTKATVLPTTDIFSFGVMMYLIITGNLPFGNLNDERDLVNYIKNGREGNWDKSTLNSNSKGKLFYPVISGCLVPQFKKRLQSVDEVLSLMPSAGKTDVSYQPTGNEVSLNVTNGILLRIMQGEEYGKVYKLNDLLQGKSRIITIGRQDIYANNMLAISENQSSYISRKHCTLELDYLTGNWYVRDGQWEINATEKWKRSLNGTFVNSTEVSKDGMPVGPGDIISIGDVKIRVEGC